MNFDDLEENLSMPELMLILEHKRKAERTQRHFQAAIQGIDLDKNESNPVQERLDEVRRRASVKMLGENEVQRQEYAELGFGFESE